MLYFRFSPSTGKGKMVTENLDKLPSQLHTYLVHLNKREGFFQKGRLLKKGRNFEISGVFLVRGLADIKVSLKFALMRFKCVCVKC